MGRSSDHVQLQVLLRAPSRNERGVAEVEAALRALGLEVTAVGRASLSARAAPETVAALFGGGSRAVRSLAPADGDPELAVPASLADRVESITVAPKHLTMSKGRPPGKRQGKT